MTFNELLSVSMPRLIPFPPTLPPRSLHQTHLNNLSKFSRTHSFLPDVALTEEGVVGESELRTILGVRLTLSSGLRRSLRRSYRKNLDLIRSFRRLPFHPDTAELSAARCAAYCVASRPPSGGSVQAQREAEGREAWLCKKMGCRQIDFDGIRDKEIRK